VVYGATRHRIPVVQEREEEVSIPVPTPFGFGPLGPDGQPLPPGPEAPGMPPIWQPPPQFAKVIKKTIVTTEESEPKVIREVSVGGVTLAASGEIHRTYSGDAGPALCPT
jgi:hypothetical protein